MINSIHEIVLNELLTSNQKKCLRRFIIADKTYTNSSLYKSNKTSVETVIRTWWKHIKEYINNSKMATVFWDAYCIIFIDYLYRKR